MSWMKTPSRFFPLANATEPYDRLVFMLSTVFQRLAAYAELGRVTRAYMHARRAAGNGLRRRRHGPPVASGLI